MNEKINEIVNTMSHTETNCFAYESGKYEINIGKSSRDIILTGSVDIKGDEKKNC